jgi:hypothetical protein
MKYNSDTVMNKRMKIGHKFRNCWPRMAVWQPHCSHPHTSSLSFSIVSEIRFTLIISLILLTEEIRRTSLSRKKAVLSENLTGRQHNWFKSWKLSGNYIYHLLWQSETHFVWMGFVWFSVLMTIISLNSVNQLISVTVKCCVFFAVRTGFLNVI